MRIITGSARGRRLAAPEGLDTRPTSEAVKEAIFSAIQFDIEGKAVVDLFAGSGQIGLEALSRGAKKAYFVDNSPESIAVIKRNVSLSGFENQSSVHGIPVTAFLKSFAGGFDIAFLDPPYEHKFIEKTLPVLAKKINGGGIIICEHEKELSLPEEIKETEFKIKKVYRYGKTSVTIYIDWSNYADINLRDI